MGILIPRRQFISRRASAVCYEFTVRWNRIVRRVRNAGEPCVKLQKILYFRAPIFATTIIRNIKARDVPERGRVFKITESMNHTIPIFYPRPVLAFTGIVVACVCPSVSPSARPSVRHQDCPRDNSLPVQARITKFRPHVYNTLVKVPVGFAVDWPWPSRSNLTSKSNFTPVWAC